MARSGSTDFGLEGSDIIRGALRMVYGMGGKLPAGRKTAETEIQDAKEALNMMLKQWQSEGVGLWLNRELNIFLAYQTGSYSLGPSGDHASIDIIETELSSSAASGATSLEVDSITGISASDAIGIELDDNTLQWTTVSGAPSGSTIIIAAALTDSASSDNNVYTYTTMSGRPLSITEARLHRDSGTDVPLEVLNRQRWMELSNKQSDGTPNCIYYDPQLDSGILNVWLRPTTVDNYIKATCRMEIQDIDTMEDDPDFPVEIHRAVKFNLACELSHEYSGIDLARYDRTRRMADKLYLMLVMADAEHISYQFKASD